MLHPFHLLIPTTNELLLIRVCAHFVMLLLLQGVQLAFRPRYVELAGCKGIEMCVMVIMPESFAQVVLSEAMGTACLRAGLGSGGDGVPGDAAQHFVHPPNVIWIHQPHPGEGVHMHTGGALARQASFLTCAPPVAF